MATYSHGPQGIDLVALITQINIFYQADYRFSWLGYSFYILVYLQLRISGALSYMLPWIKDSYNRIKKKDLAAYWLKTHSTDPRFSAQRLQQLKSLDLRWMCVDNRQPARESKARTCLTSFPPTLTPASTMNGWPSKTWALHKPKKKRGDNLNKITFLYYL